MNKIILFSLLVLGGLIVSIGGVFASTTSGTMGENDMSIGMDVFVPGPPVANPTGGTYSSSQSVFLTAENASSICYRLDGSNPYCGSITGTCAVGSTKYTGSIPVSATKTIKAIACYPNQQSSEVVSLAYTINVSSGGYPSGGGVASTPPMPITTNGQVTATSISGGQTTLTTSNLNQVKVQVPAGAVSSNTVITIEETEVGTIMIGAPSPSGQTPISTFSLTATVNGQPVTQFSGNVTITITYTDDQIAGLDESSLKIYHWDGAQWVALSTTVNLSTNTLTATTTSFSDFSVMGQESEASAAPIEPSKPVSEMTATELIAEINRLSIILAQLQQQIALLNQAQESGVIPASCQGIVFSRSLSQQMTGEDVKCLQAILNQSSDTQVASSGVGSLGRETNYFGNLTRSAVIKFQEKYRSEILTPLGLSSGTGYVGNSTIAKLNQLLGQ